VSNYLISTTKLPLNHEDKNLLFSCWKETGREHTYHTTEGISDILMCFRCARQSYNSMDKTHTGWNGVCACIYIKCLIVAHTVICCFNISLYPSISVAKAWRIVAAVAAPFSIFIFVSVT